MIASPAIADDDLAPINARIQEAFQRGDYVAATALASRAVDVAKRTFGADAIKTAQVMNNLAMLHLMQGAADRAEPLMRQALAIHEKVPGDDAPQMTIILTSLALLYTRQGKYVPARPLFERAPAILEKTAPADSPDTSLVLLGLAVLYHTQGRYADALPLYERSLRICEREKGPDHPDTSAVETHLPMLEVAMHRPHEAARLFDRARRGTRRHVARVLPSLATLEQIRFLRVTDEGNLRAALTLGLHERGDPRISSLSAGRLANGKAVAQEASSQRVILARQSTNPAAATAIAALDRAEPWVEVDAIRRSIPADGVLVDVVRFVAYEFEATGTATIWQPARYAAWIVPPAGTGNVTVVDLGPADEIDAAVKAFRAVLEADATAGFRRGQATAEENLKPEAVRPPALVLATHGFFRPEQVVVHEPARIGGPGVLGTRPPMASVERVEDPLLRCGMLLAGANLSSAGRTLPGDEGILTGAEIVGLDLAGTDLVVLSACQTGEGQVNIGESVAGLRQAFQIAGARSVVATLWMVPDTESAIIMAAFYAHLARGQPPSRALREAQLAFIRTRRADRNYEAAHPALWAAYGVTGP